MFCFIFPVIGAALVLYAFYLLASNYPHAKVWRKTTGKVIGFTEKSDNDGGTYKCPDTKFYDGNNLPAIVHTSDGVNPSPYSIDDDIIFYYSPYQPSQVLIDNVMFEYPGPVIMLFTGVTFLAISLG